MPQQKLQLNTVLVFGEDARSKVLRGAKVLYEAVSTTLGPRGRNVAIAKQTPYGDIYSRDIIHDGVNVARSIELSDEFENIGAQVLKEAAQKTVDEVGDGTTLTIVLGYHILKECARVIETGINPMELRRGLEEAKKMLKDELENNATPVKTFKEEEYIATISAADPQLGNLVALVMHDMGPDGIVTIEPSKSSETYSEKQVGMQLANGFMNQYFMTDSENMEAVLENPYILTTDKEINSLEDMTPLLTDLAHKQGKLVIISPSISPVALELLVRNKLEGKLLNLAIKAPSFGSDMKNILEDIAILTGGTFITEDAGHTLADIEISHLGRAESVISDKNSTLIIGGKGKKVEIESRKKSIKKALETEDSEFDQAKIKERLGKLDNGITVIHVGGYTEIEMKERLERVDDSVHATRAAMRKGIVPGGEIMFLRIRGILNNTLPQQILYKALEQPFNKLVSNAGKDPGELREKLWNMQHPSANIDNKDYGFDVTNWANGGFRDMIKAGIIDPVLVLLTALDNATSVAIQLMTTDVLIVPDPKNREIK